MTALEKLHAAAASELAGVIDAATPDEPGLAQFEQAFAAVDAIAQYTLALALHRLAKSGCQASAEKLTKAILEKHADNLPQTQ